MTSAIQIDATLYTQNAERVWHRPGADPFGYSDGDANENKLLAALKSCQDVSLFSLELCAHHTGWPSFYHLTSLRSNLMRPFLDLLQPGQRVLELGAGCGAVTRFLGECGADVLALEGSRRRASIIAERCRDLPNVQIVSDLIQNFESDERFDVVTLIGVLEYAQVYVPGADPIATLLASASRFLAPGGVLIVAIENQLGLKYFCGSAEDHLGHAMFGINDSYTADGPITFGRQELEGILRQAGFNDIELYVPLPDYKTPVSVVYPAGFRAESIAAGWDVSPILAGSAVHDRQRPPVPVFSLEMAWQVVGRNGLAQDLANSFLFAVRREKGVRDNEVLAAHYGSQRPAAFSKETQFILANGALATRTRRVADTARLSQAEWEIEPYRMGRLWFDALQKLMNRPKWSIDDLNTWATPWIDALRALATEPASSAIAELQPYAPLLPAKHIDATPTNMIITPSGLAQFFDLEWNFGTAVPLSFVIWRGLFLTLHRVTSCAKPREDVPHKLLDITITVMQQHDFFLDQDDLELFAALFNAFQNQTQGSPATAVNGLTAALDSAKLPVRVLFT